MQKTINCVTIDDEPHALELLKEYISRIPFLNLLRSFNDAIAGRDYLLTNQVDLLFIDINMPDISGLKLVESLPSRPIVIFTTAHKKFALEGFELDAVDYLLKPISPDRFERAVGKAAEYFNYRSAAVTEMPEALFVYAEYRIVKIELETIVYIESLEDYIRLYIDNEKPVLTLMTLKKVLEKLPASDFRRIHRSYIVPVKKVRAIHNRRVTLINGTELPVSDSYSDFIAYWKRSS